MDVNYIANLYSFFQLLTKRGKILCALWSLTIDRNALIHCLKHWQIEEYLKSLKINEVPDSWDWNCVQYKEKELLTIDLLNCGVFFFPLAKGRNHYCNCQMCSGCRIYNHKVTWFPAKDIKIKIRGLKFDCVANLLCKEFLANIQLKT